MSTSFSRLIARVAILAALVTAAASTFAQIPAGSSARAIPTEVEKTDVRVSQIIARAEDHFRKGKLNLDDNKREAARDEFDKAVDTILESGLNVRESQRLQPFYLELVERIYREEVPIGHGLPQTTTVLVAQSGRSSVSSQGQTQRPHAAPAQSGFSEQKFD